MVRGGQGGTGSAWGRDELAGSPSAPPRNRIIDAALACIVRQGVAKTTVDDVARAAGLSRATVYRVFPGGKDELLRSTAESQVATLFTGLAARLSLENDVRGVLVTAISGAAAAIADHPALATLLNVEPEVVLRLLAFDEGSELLRMASTFGAPFLARWMPMEEAARVAEWACRIILTYVVDPSDRVDCTDPVAVGRLVETFVLPGVRALRGPAADEPFDLTSAATDRDAAGSARRSREHDHRHHRTDHHRKGEEVS